MFLFPKTYIESLMKRDFSDRNLQLFIDILPNQALAALSTIATIGQEKICFPESNISINDVKNELTNQLFSAQTDGLIARNLLLEKSGNLRRYLEEGLGITTSLGIFFIEPLDYWENCSSKSTHSYGKASGIKPQNTNLSETFICSKEEAMSCSSPFTFQTPVTPTFEQQKILGALASLEKGDTLKTQAFAGTGKTTLCSFIAEDFKGKVLYLSFNKAMIEYGKNKLGHFGNRVFCSTLDSLSYAIVKPRDVWGSQRLDITAKNNWEMLADRLGIPQGANNLRRGVIARHIDTTVTNYCHSADQEILPSHVHPGSWSEGLEKDVMSWAQTLFEMLIAPHKNETLIIKPQHVMKYWDLKGGVIPPEYEIILLDEAQDINPVFISILHRSSNPRILIGDNYQQLYSWRGAVNALSGFEGSNFELTQSFRYGPDLASYANRILAVKTNPPPSPIIGNTGISTQVIPYSASSPNIEWPGCVILGRTNVEIFTHAAKIAEAGHRLHIIGGVDEIKRQLLDALKLYNNQTDRIVHPSISRFRSWADLVDYQEMAADPELKRVRTLIEKYGMALEGQLNAVSQSYEPDERRAPNILSTTHKVKGREWERVMLLKDFVKPEDLCDLQPNHRDEELNVLYVAATRAIRELYIPETHTFE